ncbi:S-adenosyl-L-methionine-dependent methyltransferase [Roridomyces roridus]|uniref:S-adenosyl-L-methionine-dependent methyltransferase n=1 Tax=Roridomyces roridus TaxID=1738132 RepID=A0AAD7FQL5_9AGAR|nr:S-adenosyl-L-methionine-dependent methyltransferase [Roridomyces roridus]
MGPPSQIVSSLLTLITQAAQTLEAGYDGSIPSLDDTQSHPLDGKLSTPDMQEAVQVLEGACAQLCATLARPNHTLLNKFYLTVRPRPIHLFRNYPLHHRLSSPTVLNAALKFKIPDILQDKPLGMHITEIAKICGTEPSKLARILRLLSAKHCFREVEKDVFANNRLSVQLLTSNPLHSLGLHMTFDSTGGATKLAETLADPEWGPSFVPVHSAWNKFTGQPLAMFDYWASTLELQQQGEGFGIGMIGWGTTIEAATVVHAYPWEALGPGATVCDLGGGVGAMAMELARAHPNLKLKLQDLPDRMVQAETVVWPAECPEAIKGNRIEFKAVDFFAESPIAGCDVYYLKNVLHAFPTAECLTILKGIRKVMKPGSRVLIRTFSLSSFEWSLNLPVKTNIPYRLLPPAVLNLQDRQLKPAPAPLLSNYGEGRIRQYRLDVNLMVLVNGRERTLDEYIELGEQAGLRFLKVWEFGDLSGVELCVAEGS